MDITVISVFIAGILAFLSPCIFPIMPIYITYLAGQSKNKGILYKNSIMFLLGFTVVHVGLGIISSYVYIDKMLMNKISGYIIIILGLFMLNIFKLNFKKININNIVDLKKLTITKSFIFGFFLSLSWIPCTGPVLGTVLVLTARENNLIFGSFMLLIYSIGFSIPFLTLTFFYEKLKKKLNIINSNLDIIRKIAGLLLIILGILVVTNNLSILIGG